MAYSLPPRSLQVAGQRTLQHVRKAVPIIAQLVRGDRQLHAGHLRFLPARRYANAGFFATATCPDVRLSVRLSVRH